MDFESCNSAAQFAIPQSQNTFVIPNATPFIEFGLNMLATGHVGLIGLEWKEGTETLPSP